MDVIAFNVELNFRSLHVALLHLLKVRQQGFARLLLLLLKISQRWLATSMFEIKSQETTVVSNWFVEARPFLALASTNFPLI